MAVVASRSVPRLLQSGVFFGLLLLAGFTASAQAQGYAGNWRGGPARMQVAVESWGRDCGPRPQSHTGDARGAVRISEDGDHLVLHGTPERRTDRCWSDNRDVRRVSSSHNEGTWRVVCRTRPQDPRAETGSYSLTASADNRLSYREVSNYDWQLNESRCTARITVTQVFTRASAAVAPTKVAPEPAPTQCTPGAPARLRLRPREAQVEPGGAVRFTARVVDRSGCPVPGQQVRWELTRPSAANAELEGGLFTAAEGAAEAEGEFTVTASARGSSARATVVVRTADLSDLIARRTTVGVTETEDVDVELTTESVAEVSARGDEEDSEGSSLLPFIIATALVLALLLAVAVTIVARRGRAKAAPADLSSPFPGEEPGSMVDSPDHAARAGSASTASSPVAVPAGEALICPTCRRGFGPETKTCPSDGETLISYVAFTEEHRVSQTAGGGKICPSCGERYGQNRGFCGKDGTALVEIN